MNMVKMLEAHAVQAVAFVVMMIVQVAKILKPFSTPSFASIDHSCLREFSIKE